jgi:ribosomal protein S18 acetylase RimI-like enzyme
MSIDIIPGYSHPKAICRLFTEYTSLLMEGEPQFARYLQLQNFDEEMACLETKYGYPEGRLYLALVDGEPAGCIALRRLDARRCEMKRLYVHPAFRGLGIGKLLTGRVLEDARSIGYHQILLDTFPFLDRAISMYRSMGFREIPKYNNSPVDTTIYMALEL